MKSSKPLQSLLLSSALLLAACGGGGGASVTASTQPANAGSSPAPAPVQNPPSTPAPNPVTVPVKDYSVTTHAIPTAAAGQVFSLKANFFDDGFVPPSPMSNYGFQNPIIPAVNADGSLDVAWLDYSGASGHAVSGLSTPGTINITHVNPDLSTGATTATSLQTYKLLGFTKDSNGAFYLAYNVDHPFKNAIAGDANNVDGNELRIAKSASANFGLRAWDTLVFGDQDNTKDMSKGNPGEAGLGMLGFDAINQKLVLYVSHQMASGDHGIRHQAGYFRYFNPLNGVPVAAGNGNALNMGSSWFYSHNFSPRLLVDNGTSYLLAHGDYYSRQLGFAAYTYGGYTGSDQTQFDKSYFAIDGNKGDNNTNAQTGQFIKLNNGNFAMVHTTSQGRAARDVRIVIAGGSDGGTQSSAWLTSNAANVQAIMPKLEASGSGFLVSYGLWNSSDRTNKSIEWHFMQLDAGLNVISQSKAMPGIEFIADLPLLRFTSGPNAGRVGWVSGNDQGTLSVNLVQAPQ
ncbi:hypothetical protein [Paraherbaspirillum soli]|uniref:hypothetical protein n=1 Tax=Paraherbaspirillum soli TaxID=631222 RepID=UPI00367236A0